MDLKKMAGKSMKPGGGGRFAALKSKLEGEGKSAGSAAKIAASAGMAKWGKAGLQSLAQAGRRRASR